MAKIPFTKVALSTPDMVAFLEGKGLQFRDKELAHRKLEYIGYYRLKIYTRHFEDNAKQFVPGAHFEDIILLYEFDRKLRLICMDAIERLEVALRARIIDVMCAVGGPHFWQNPYHFETTASITTMTEIAEKWEQKPIIHYKNKYDDPVLPAIWCLTEASTFGEISKLFADLQARNRNKISKFFGYDEKVLVSWFRSINFLRNICAHHGRLWNADLLVNMPTKAKKYATELADNKTFYARAVVLRALLNEIDKSYSDDWSKQLQQHIQSQPLIPLDKMGFPEDWVNRPLWL